MASIVLAAGALLQACGGSKTTGPAPVNNPPVIQSIVAGSPIVDADQSIQLTAAVSDSEVASSQFTYQWSASPANGTFTGSGAQVRWKAPATLPETYTINLTVVEAYKASDGTTKENRVSSTTQVRYNDLIITGLVSTFLTDFGTFAKTAAECVRNFSDNCVGKSQEFADIVGHRANVRIESATFSIASITPNASVTSADIVAPCQFKDVRNSDGKHQTSTGNCRLGTVYEGSRWLLCYSNYDSISVVVEAEDGRMIAVDKHSAPYSHP